MFHAKGVPSAVAAHATLALAGAARASDWTNAGGDPGRDGRTSELGPDAASPLWSTGRPSIIAWQPVIEGSRVFLVRQTGFPPGGEPNGSPVVAMDLDTGGELWFRHVPYVSGDWTTWVAGVRDGRVFASRSGNGASVSAPLYALDAASGATLWVSADLIDAGPYDGVVFAPNGDPVIASFQDIWRIRASDGTTAWHTPRVGSVSGNCGAAIHGDAVYVADAAVGGHVIKRFDLDTGAFEYQGPLMSGFTLQNSPFAGPDGTIYLSRTQNNAATDFFYAFADDGSAITTRWSVPAGWSTSSEFTVGPDGSVYMLAPGNEIHRLDPATGATIDTSGPVSTTLSAPRMASDAQGRLFVTNGGFAAGRMYSFDADLAPRWSVAVANVNIGGPAVGRDGTLVVAGTGTDVRAYRTPRPAAPFCFGDGSGNPCPCGNGGAPGHGCDNAAATGGVELTVHSFAPNGLGGGTVDLFGAGYPPLASPTVVAFRSLTQAGGGLGTPFGDGLLCVGAPVTRVGTAFASGGISITSLSHGAGPGTFHYQLWYRSQGAFCMPEAFNLSNGTTLVWP